MVRENYKKFCEVCGKEINVDIYGQGKCPYCDWFNCVLNEEAPNNIALPNLLSLNRAKQLYAENKPLEPNLDDFIEALFCYSETQFCYNGIYYGVILTAGNKKDENFIEFFEFDKEKSIIFKTKEEFKNNAKIGDEYIKDIWDKTTDRYWLQ